MPYFAHTSSQQDVVDHDATIVNIKLLITKISDEIEQQGNDVKILSAIEQDLDTLARNAEFSTNAKDLNYLYQVLNQLHRYLKDNTIENKESLSQLINLKTGYNIDLHLLDAILYGTGAALSISLAILTLVALTAFTIANLNITIFFLVGAVFVVQPIILTDLGRKAVAGEDAAFALMGGALGLMWFGELIFHAPELFFLGASAYVGSAMSLAAAYYGTKACLPETKQAYDTYTLKSDIRALLDKGLFSVGDSSIGLTPGFNCVC